MAFLLSLTLVIQYLYQVCCHSVLLLTHPQRCDLIFFGASDWSLTSRLSPKGDSTLHWPQWLVAGPFYKQNLNSFFEVLSDRSKSPCVGHIPIFFVHLQKLFLHPEGSWKSHCPTMRWWATLSFPLHTLEVLQGQLWICPPHLYAAMASS